MARRNMKGALDASMRAEAQTVRDRFEVAESVLAGRQPAVVQPPVVQQSPRTDATRKPPQPPAPPQSVTKVVRDSFTMPVSDYELITGIRDRCLKRGTSATKAEVLRAALAALSSLPDDALLEIVQRLPKVKTGRPAVGADSV